MVSHVLTLPSDLASHLSVIPYLTISIVALLAAALTFFSGFGLGTLLLPAFAIFLPVEVAVGATAVVHLANNLFKVALMGRHADRAITPVFAATSAAGALVGAYALTRIVGAAPLCSYAVFGHAFHVTLVKVVVAALMIGFAILDLTPATSRWGLPRRYLWMGGLLSGFFGGLSGHQGALRSAFLVRTNMPKEALVGTRAVCAVAVDASRLLVYSVAAFMITGGASPTTGAAATARSLHESGTWPLVAVGCGAALLGSLLGTRLLKEVTIVGVRATVAVALLLMGVAVGAGLV